MTEIFSHGYALLIGVGESAYPKLSLPVTVQDTQAVQQVLMNQELCGYSQENIRILNNQEATLNNILDGLTWLQHQAQSDPEATIFIYYSGHGLLQKLSHQYYLLQHDIDPWDLPGSALSAKEFTDHLRKIPAKRLLVIIDSCHAAGMATSKDGENAPSLKLPPEFEQVALSKGLIETLQQGQGRVVFTSCQESESSYIRKDEKNSIYTYHLLEALQGAGNQPGDTDVRVSDLMKYLGKSVPASAEKLGVKQTPYVDMATEDFVIAKLRGGKGLPEKGWDGMKSEAAARINNIAEVIMQNVSGKNIVGKIEGNNNQVGDRTINTGGGEYQDGDTYNVSGNYHEDRRKIDRNQGNIIENIGRDYIQHNQ